AQAREWEGLPVQTGWLRGEGATALTIREHDWQLTLDVAEGHKTGYYLDQRDSRRRFADAVRQYRVKTVLNCFSYTGGFSVA
ncbi:class I SAM-dependent methyltransferase, partial [Acinetobacter baumannii]